MELTDIDLEVVAAGLEKPKGKPKKAEAKTVPHPTVVTPLAAPVTRAGSAQGAPAGCSGGSCHKA